MVLMIVAATVLAAEQRADLWQKVDDAQKQGLPKTAIEHLDAIIKDTMQAKAYPEAIKAIGRKIALEGVIQGNKPEEKITRLEAEIAKAPKEMVPVMDAIMADWYWQYFQENRWRFIQRTQTAQEPGKDILTWDLPHILSEIDKQFTKALANDAELKKTKIAEYDALLTKGTLPDTYRPTLYDFLAFEALNFYTTGEQAGAKAEDAFELKPDSRVFDPAEQFIKWEIKSSDDSSLTVKALRLYQQVLAFHQNDADKAAFLDADLLRLQYGYNKAVGEDKAARYTLALKGFVEKWATHEVSAQARLLWAGVLRQQNEPVEARKIAAAGWEAFRDTPGGRGCYNVIQQIEARLLQVETERVWNEPWPTINVRYRNITQVHFRLVAYDWKARRGGNLYRPEQLERGEREQILNSKPILEWSTKLPSTGDYRARIEETPAPRDIKPGSYFLLASNDAGFTDQGNEVIFTDIWVSKLALVIRENPGAGVIEGLVLDANSGEPVRDAQVQAWMSSGFSSNTLAAGPEARTDANGLFSISTGRQAGDFRVLVTSQDQQVASGIARRTGAYGRHEPYKRTILFTDRSLYRPGQTVQYKGICVDVDAEGGNYKTVADQTLTVFFEDANRKEIAHQEHRTNDYGSFSGSFTAPTDRMPGKMSLHGFGGDIYFNVEEYKRPKFQVRLEVPQTAAKLNERVSLQAKATAYTGAPIDGAKVSWRVVRQVRYPDWWGWYYWWRTPQMSSQEIAHGIATTAADGSFPVEFVAKPDLTVPEKDEPAFCYTISTEVTDTTGETRFALRTVNVGYTALAATLSAADWQTEQKPVEINILTQTLDGVGQKADVALKVYRLKQPGKVVRANLTDAYPGWMRFERETDDQPQPDLSNPNCWELGEVVFDQGVTTDAEGKGAVKVKLPAGAFRAMLETRDRFGKKVTARLPIQVLGPQARPLAIKAPTVVAAPKWSLEPGEPFTLLWATGYEKARAFIEIECDHKIVRAFWTEPGATQHTLTQPVTEPMRGGFTLRVTMVRENRAYFTSRQVSVPWSNKELKVTWEHFTSKLEPGQKETWTAVISGPDARRAVAEIVAAVYDQSLDQFLPHQWQRGFGVFRVEQSWLTSHFENMLKYLDYFSGYMRVDQKDGRCTYRTFPDEISKLFWFYAYPTTQPGQFGGFGGGGGGRGGGQGGGVRFANSVGNLNLDSAQRRGQDRMEDGDAAVSDEAKRPDLTQVTARKNLNETAFFFPHLVSDKDGLVKMEFTMPEALTQWKFLGFAHDRDLRAGLLQDSLVTAKDLMVQPNPPRFLREGDVLEFTVKVSNQSAAMQNISVRLTLADLRTGKSVDAELGNTKTDQTAQIPSKESRSFSWRLTVPDGCGPISYKAVASTGRLSDGEEGAMPVLSRRILVTESLPLPIRGAQTKTFDFTKLEQSKQSTTLQNQSLTVQMVSNPAWYAVMALPYLVEFPYECNEQTFNRLYANSLARHIANSDPKIRRVFDQWKGTPALDSPLEKNQDLKAVMLEETPWLRQAQAESQARRNVGILFDDNRLNTETARLMQKLAEQQHADGLWPWFPGGRGDEYITLYITTGFGRLRHLGVKQLDMALAVKSLGHLDGWIDEIYRDILRNSDKEKNHLSPLIAFYLYGRSFFLEDQKIAPQHKEAVDYFLAQAKKYWLELPIRQSQAHLALALNRFGDKAAAKAIMASMKERSVSNEEMGMFWRDTELSWSWYRAPIETQALMIEAFDEVMNDAKAAEDCRVWLLKQKQTQDWKTSKATADAIYGLLLRGDNLLASDALVEVTLGDLAIKPDKVEAGTGFYEQRLLRSEIKPEFGKITLKKTDAGVSWGSVHWQYLEDMSKITPHEGTPLKLQKALFTRVNTAKGPVLQPVKEAVKVGDELVVRITLAVDRDMEYVHLKDYRGSGTEPVNVLSRYKYQDGLGYYEATRDTASHFFIDYLPKGTYVFEYAVRVQHRGRYQTGVASIQCMYAPEFNSHSASLELDVK
jgi:uncharacterized protein YfaS (alpha-2-macroglobulin family)